MNKTKFLLLSSIAIIGFSASAIAANETSREGTSTKDGKVTTSGVLNAAKSYFSNSDEIPEWAQRIEFEGSFDDKPSWTVLTTQPIYQSEDKVDTFFVQLSGLSYETFGEDRITTNLGIGYRRLAMDKSLMLGVNTFYDQDWKYDHQRSSIGFEARSMPIELNTNLYNANSGLKTVNPTLTERALGGWDSEVGVQIPYLPWAKAFIQKYEWNAENSRDLNGNKYSLRLQPASWLEVEGGMDNSNLYDENSFAKVNFKMRFNENQKPIKLLDDKPFAFGESMEDKTLEKVRRTNKIIVERNSSVGGTLTFTVSRGS